MFIKSTNLYSFLLLIFFISFCPSLFAQQVEKKESEEQEIPLNIELETQALEGAVDPNSYIIGPGDEFIINIWSAEEAAIRTAVTPEGKLVIPTVGTLNVDGKTLTEVQSMVREAGAKKYIKSKITANLVLLKSFRVHVTGQVMNPGPYQVLAVERLSDVIKKAGGLTTWAFESAIEVRHRDGRIDTVDLNLYKKLGRIESNIYLKGGDIIFVPSINFSEATVRLEGRVNNPGIYQLVDNETLEDFLLRITFHRRADLRSAYIERKTGDDGNVEIIPIFPYLEKRGNDYSDLYLRDEDVIIFPQEQVYVYVIGAVGKPGSYPYIPNLRARDYVGYAGSTEQAVKLSKVKVIRRNRKIEEQGEDLLVEPGDTVFVPQKAKFGIVEAFTILGQITGILIAMSAIGIIN